MLPIITGEFGVVADPELKFSDKGNAWMRIRAAAKDRVRDANGQWADGPAMFIDVIIMGKSAEHLMESVAKGDSIMVIGKLEQTEWTDNEGNKKTSLRIRAEEIGVSTRWNPAKTPKLLESGAMQALAPITGEDTTLPPF